MSNNFFQFKQFRVDQENCAMKVTTEACILGAWVEDNKPEDILDIGTGTGLLSLMVAQRIGGNIDAVELDKAAASQAEHNFNESPWWDRLNAYNSSIQDFQTETQYDLIVCNPPFFKDHMKSSDPKKNIALHDDSLSQEDLLEQIDRLLAPEGTAYVLLPFYESKQFRHLAANRGIKTIKSLKIYNHKHGDVFRVVLCLNRTKPASGMMDILIIRDEANYSKQFISLLHDYYLHL